MQSSRYQSVGLAAQRAMRALQREGLMKGGQSLKCSRRMVSMLRGDGLKFNT